QQRHESKIFYQIDLSELLNDYAIFKVLFYVAQHPDTELVIGVYNAWQEGIKQVEDKVEELISDYLDLKDFLI
ncbi:accessory Sec system glycosyltransferase Asp1, partial [Streptococcus salivarius]|uniref:accessory Sec system glycosyltransferase Asp1 n=1 Tax=Streptococcus salivarius TaxID=1304 RepID=UPI001D08C0F8